jgi:signal peptidase II
VTSAWRNRSIGLVLAAAIYGLDRWIKALVAGPLGLLYQGDHLDLLPFFDLTRTHNFGVSLGMFEATSPEMRWGLVAMTGVIAVVVLVWLLRERLLSDIAGLALILGGALGNIHDRVEIGYVLDYADFHIGTFRPFLIFNLADACITVGVLIILARALFMREKPPAPHGENHAPQAEHTADPTAESSKNA